MNNQQGQQPQWPPSHPSYGQSDQEPLQYPSQWQQPPSRSLPLQQQWRLPKDAPPQYQQPLQYQPQIPPPQMTPQKLKSRNRLWLIIGAMILVLIVIGAIVSQAGNKSQSVTTSQATQPASTGQQQQPSAQPTYALQWTTVQTITGNGSKKTAIFTAPADWKIVWSCIGQKIDGVTADGLLVVSVYNAGGSIADPGAVDAMCKAGQTKTTGETEEHQAGQVYLSVVGTGDWTIQIQESK